MNRGPTPRRVREGIWRPAGEGRNGGGGKGIKKDFSQAVLGQRSAKTRKEGGCGGKEKKDDLQGAVEHS